MTAASAPEGEPPSVEGARSILRVLLLVTAVSLFTIGGIYILLDPSRLRAGIFDVAAALVLLVLLRSTERTPPSRDRIDWFVAAIILLGLALEVEAGRGYDSVSGAAIVSLLLAAAGGFLRRLLPLALVTVAATAAWLYLRARSPVPGDLLTEGPILFAGAAVALVFQTARRWTDRRLDESRREEARQRAALAESERRFRLIAEGVQEVFWLQDGRTGRLHYLSPSYRAIWGRDPQEMLRGEHSFLDTVFPEDRARVERTLATHARGGADAEYRIVRPDGTIRWIRDRSYAVRDGETEMVVGVAEDVTERRALEARYRTIFHGMPTPAWIYDYDSLRIIEVNEAAVAHYGYTRERFLSMTLLDLRPKEDIPTFLAVRSTIDPSRTRQAEARHVKADGTLIDVLVTAANFESLGPRLALAVCQDVTQKNRAGEAARRDERLASLGTLVAGVAHEINNPLAYMRGNVELAQLDLEDALAQNDPAATRAALEKLSPILAGIDQIARITGELRLVARPSSGRRERVDLADVVEEAIRVSAPRLPPGCTLRRSLAPAAVEAVSGDVGRVVLNLLLNAADAVRSVPGPTLEVSLEVRDGTARLAVTDNGPGIPQAERHLLFTPFHTTKPHGTGLGLTTSLAIARDHGGDIRFESAPGRATTFVLSLPSAEAAPTREAARSPG